MTTPDVIVLQELSESVVGVEELDIQVVEAIEQSTVSAEEAVVTLVSFAEQGPAGPQGLQGPRGEKGEKGDSGSSSSTAYSFYLSDEHIAAKGFDLPSVPTEPSSILVTVHSGISQFPNEDFLIQGNHLSWSQLAMEMLVEAGVLVHVAYR